MPNTGLVNGELVNGTGESYFSGTVITFKQIVQSVYKNQLLCNNIYNGAMYNTYAYNSNSVNCFWSDYFIVFKQNIGEITPEALIANFILQVKYRSSGGGNILGIEGTVNYLKASHNIIYIENIVEENG